MADLSDVETALVGIVSMAIYPNGVGCAVPICQSTRVFRGWPSDAQIAKDRAAGGTDISITTVPDSVRNTTRWPIEITVLPRQSSLAVASSGNSATFSGIATTGDTAGILVGQAAYIYTAQTGDSAALVAAALGDLIRVNTICWVSQASMTVPGVTSLTARVAGHIDTLEEWARQEELFRISVWAPNPASRDATGALITQLVAETVFLTLADGTGGRVRLHNISNIDSDQAASIYRRDIIVAVEYGTTLIRSNPTMLFGDLDWNGTTMLA